MKIKGYKRFQHFKDRRPPWIKLYRDILDDPEWFSLSGPDAKVLVMLWLVASEDESGEGQLPCLTKLAFRFRLSEEKITQTLQRLMHWVDQDDIKLISSRYQDDAPEGETEERRGETEREGDPPAPTISPSSRAKKLEELEAMTLTPALQAWAMKEFQIVIPQYVLAEFKDHWREEKKLRKDWTATFQNRVGQLVNWGQLKPASKPAAVGGKAYQKHESTIGRYDPMPEDFLSRIGKAMP